MKSYGYLKNDTETLDMTYADIVYNDEVYRKVTITDYRPFYTTKTSSADNSNQIYNGYETGTLRIPEEIDGIPVTAIGYKAFRDKDGFDSIILWGCEQLLEFHRIH